MAVAIHNCIEEVIIFNRKYLTLPYFFLKYTHTHRLMYIIIKCAHGARRQDKNFIFNKQVFQLQTTSFFRSESLGKSAGDFRQAFQRLGKSAGEVGRAFHRPGKSVEEVWQAFHRLGKSPGEVGQAFHRPGKSPGDTGHTVHSPGKQASHCFTVHCKFNQIKNI